MSETQDKGIKLIKSIGPGNLYKGAGKLARKEGTTIFCGTIAGLIFGVDQKSNRLNPEKPSTVFFGDFIAIGHDGQQVKPLELYLPSLLENSFRAMVQKADGAVRFAIDVYAEPDDSESNTIGYRYTVKDRLAARTINPALELVYEAGILERPAAQLTDQTGQRGYDPDTGEIAEEAAQEDNRMKRGNRKAA